MPRLQGCGKPTYELGSRQRIYLLFFRSHHLGCRGTKRLEDREREREREHALEHNHTGKSAGTKEAPGGMTHSRGLSRVENTGARNLKCIFFMSRRWLVLDLIVTLSVVEFYVLG